MSTRLSRSAQHEWVVDRYEAFPFRGPSGNPAIADLAIVTRDGAVPVVVATERGDNPGISVTNGAEQLAAQVLIRIFPERIGQGQPFRLVEHYRGGSEIYFDGVRWTDKSSMQEVQFKDFRLRGETVPRIGEASEWLNLDERIAKVIAEQVVQRADARAATLDRKSTVSRAEVGLSR
jgi:hypothetical protein